MQLQKKLAQVLEANGWSFDQPQKQGKDYYLEINHETPAGEDWWETIWYDGTIEGFDISVYNRFMEFDVDEDVEMWVERRGKNGVPNSIRTLVENAEYKEEALKKLSDALGEVV